MIQASPHTCNTCDSKLIQVSKVTEVLEGTRFPQTTTIYRCSNQECQDEKDKQTNKRIKIQSEKDLLNKKRLEGKATEKRILEKITQEESSKESDYKNHN